MMPRSVSIADLAPRLVVLAAALLISAGGAPAQTTTPAEPPAPTPPAHADEPAPPAHEPATPAPDGQAPKPDEPAAVNLPESGEKLHISLAPYLWLTSLSGTVGVNGINANLNVTFGDIVRDASKVYGFMGALDVEYGRLVFEFNGAYSHVEVQNSGNAPRAPGVKIGLDVTSDAGWYEFTGGYRFVDVPVEGPESKRRFRLDGLAGARLTDLTIHNKATASGNVTLPDGTMLPVGVQRSVDGNQTWVEPYFGARAIYDITDTMAVGLRGDIGGFGAGSDFAWQGVFLLGWRFPMGSANGALLLGYRALGQNYENGGFKWDMIVYGPVLGLQISF